jgi:glutamate synthase (NADPH/NADH) small chain
VDIWKDLQRVGVGFVGQTYIGKKKTVNDLFHAGYEGIFLGVGSGIDAPLDLPGETLPGVYKATDFLVRANADPRALPARLRHLPTVGRRVVVIGGGDPATDCARTARRLGAEEVTCLYRYTELEIPGRRRDRRLAEEEGVRFEYLTQPLRLVAGEDGRLAGVECQHIELSAPDDNGQCIPELVGDSFFIQAEHVVAARVLP